MRGRGGKTRENKGAKKESSEIVEWANLLTSLKGQVTHTSPIHGGGVEPATMMLKVQVRGFGRWSELAMKMTKMKIR